jgi:DNA polymerase/3'-5' exonuclease PolX
MNQDLIRNLNDLAKYHKQAGDRWRDQAYQKAISSIKTIPFTITDVSQVKNLPGVGSKIREKINQFLMTGDISQVGEIKKTRKRLETANTKAGAIFRLERVWGVGPVKANSLYEAGITTIDKLNKNKHLLNRQQLIGLKYYDDLIRRIDREDIFMFNVLLVYTLNKEFGKGSYDLEIAGSYRRGESDSGDIDCLIHSKSFTLEDAVAVLKDAGVIAEVLATKESKFEGVAFSPTGGGQYLRLDIEFVKHDDEWGSEMLYFTGNKGINIMMRGEAKKKGLILNQRGLFNRDGKRIPAYTEKEIFQALGVSYIDPKNR